MLEQLKQTADRIAKKHEEMQEELAKIGREDLTAAYQQVFDAHPELVAIRWSQYTPYFNDGDQCVFGVHEMTAKFADTKEENCEDDWEGEAPESDDPSDLLGFEYLSPYYMKVRHPECLKSLDELETLHQRLEDVLEQTFDDHVKVTVARGSDGKVKIGISDYDHE